MLCFEKSTVSLICTSPAPQATKPQQMNKINNQKQGQSEKQGVILAPDFRPFHLHQPN